MPMQGLELCRLYYEQYGRPMLERDFPEFLPLIAVGAVGSGSERYGFDDAVSRDHDFEPGFCIFLPGEDIVSRRTAFLLERAYAKLPEEFCGVRRQRLSPVGGNRFGPMRTADFYIEKTGTPDGRLSVWQWLTLPDHALAESTNGSVFYDGYGAFSEIRERLCDMPEDVRRKRLSGNLLLMAQSGQYNAARCLAHGEPEAAALSCREFVSAALKVRFLLHKRYLPYYKWSFRALRTLPGTEMFASYLSRLLLGGPPDASAAEMIEAAAAETAALLREQGLSDVSGNTLEEHAYAVNDGIRDSGIRNMHILAAV